MLNDLEAKIFQYGFLEDHMVCENNLYWFSTKRNEGTIMATKPEFWFTKEEMLILSLGIRY